MINQGNTKEQIISLWNNLRSDELLVDNENIGFVSNIANIFAPGSYFYYVFNYAKDEPVFVHPNAKSMINLDITTFSVNNYLNCIHPDDLENLYKKEQYAKQFLAEYLSPDQILRYKISYALRLRKPDGSYYLNLHQSTGISTTSSGSLAQVVCTESDVSHMGDVSLDRISFIDLDGKHSFLDLDINDYQFDEEKETKKLTDRECEVLKLISFGFDNDGIAKRLFISPHTVRTHRKNILIKENSKSIVQVVCNYIRAGRL